MGYLHHHCRKGIHAFAALLLLLAFCGCAGTIPRNPVPPELATRVEIPGIPHIRFWGDEWPQWSKEAVHNASHSDLIQLPSLYNTRHHYLAISGGGANGAFGAGLLCGWTAAGTRPEFTMVTGISTGALTAPFAFLGQDYDGILKTIYTTTSTQDILKKKGVFSALFSDSITDTSPLKAMIVRYIRPDIVEAIAREYKKGRQLFVGTFNLDAGRSVIWNIGRIAASDYSKKIKLIHEILRASAAIPVAFPPVVIEVKANGELYDELHVDGGIGSQVFVYPAAFDWKAITEKFKVHGSPEVYIIRNSFLESSFHGVKRELVPIAVRSLDSLIKTQGFGDFYQIYALCQRDGIDFNLTWIPSDFTAKSTQAFDPVYMTQLFDKGFQMALEGYDWQKAPPGFFVKP